MIDRELMEWAVEHAATGAETTPDIDMEAVVSYAIYRAAKFGRDAKEMNVPQGEWLAASFAHVFCIGVACGRAEQVTSPDEAAR